MLLSLKTSAAGLLFACLLAWGPSTGWSVVAAEEYPSEPPLILAHYMPWYSINPIDRSDAAKKLPSTERQWGWHWTMNHFDPENESNGKRPIASKFYPLIGPYDSGDPDVLEYHLLLMKSCGIDGVIVDWYGLTNYRDYAVLHRNTTRMLQQCERLNMKFVICYEDQTIPALVDGKKLSEADRVSHAVNEIQWLSKYWFKSPSYTKSNGRPLILSFGHSGLTKDEWSQCLDELSTPVAYVSQDIRRDGAVGGFGWPSPNAGMQQVDRFLTESREWPVSIPAVFPRFDDIYKEANVSNGYPTLPDNNGKTLKMTLQKAIDSKAAFIQLATWNDWGEGTQIEPSLEFQFRDLELVRSMLQKTIKPDLTTQNRDDQVVLQIFKQRRSEQFDASKLDEIVQLIVAEKWGEARRAIAKFPPVLPTQQTPATSTTQSR